MRPLTDTIPKPMVRIGEYPLLHHIMNQYSQHGIDEFIICLGYRGDVIKDYFLNYRRRYSDVEVDLSKNEARYMTPESSWKTLLAETGEKTMTGGRLLAVKKYLLPDEPFFFTYGDALSDVDIGGTLRFHKKHGKLLTMTVVHPKSSSGVVTLEDDIVRAFHEKPIEKNRWINGGYFVADYGIFDYINGNVQFEENPIQQMVMEGQIAAYRHDGWWESADTEKEITLLNHRYKN